MKDVSTEEFDALGSEVRGALQSFQQVDRLHVDFTRRLGFEAFVLFCLETLESQPHIQGFGYKLSSKATFEYDDFGAPLVVITQTPTVICNSTIPVLRNYAELYASVFPFNTALEGEYAISRKDKRVHEYLTAAAEKNHPRRRAIVAVMGAEAEQQFRTPALEIRIRGATY